MKKLLYLFALSTLILTSCNSDDDSTNDDTDKTNPEINNILPIKVVIEEDGDIITINFTYDGKKIIKEEGTGDIEGYYMDYIYEGDKLTELNLYENDELDSSEIFSYDSEGKISSYTSTLPVVGTLIFDLSYNTDNSRIEEIQRGFSGSPSISIINNGNLIETTSNSGQVTNYTYDDKNGPFRNVESREAHIGIDTELNLEYEFTSLNNILTETYSSGISNYKHTYTDSGFPRTTIMEYDDGDFIKYTYTYNND